VRAVFATLLATIGLLAAGCGAVTHMTATDGKAVSGKTLFQQSCGACHVLADAGTTGTQGPSLDDVFGLVREQGFDESTIRDVVRGQIAYPEEPMPANLVEGQQAQDVADYVAECAGVESCDLGG
jgi:mono/diheme cytochrome c family protein